MPAGHGHDRLLTPHGTPWPGRRCTSDPPTDSAEERTLRRLAAARHAPASLIQRARIIYDFQPSVDRALSGLPEVLHDPRSGMSV